VDDVAALRSNTGGCPRPGRDRGGVGPQAPRPSRNVEIAEVGSISANGQKMIGSEIAEAMQKVGHYAASS